MRVRTTEQATRIRCGVLLARDDIAQAKHRKFHDGIDQLTIDAYIATLERWRWGHRVTKGVQIKWGSIVKGLALPAGIATFLLLSAGLSVLATWLGW